jgi:hypothetical protein
MKIGLKEFFMLFPAGHAAAVKGQTRQPNPQQATNQYQ